LIPWLSQTKRF